MHKKTDEVEGVDNNLKSDRWRASKNERASVGRQWTQAVFSLRPERSIGHSTRRAAQEKAFGTLLLPLEGHIRS